jgi:hypothetical protein
MSIDEAISLLTGIEGGNSLKYLPEHRDAVKLGIEALWREVHIRMFHHDQWEGLLPGETKE